MLILSIAINHNGYSAKTQKGDISNEFTLKALFIYNFTKHVDWSNTNTNDKFKIVIAGKSDITKCLESILQNRKIQNKSIEIIESISEENIQNAQILFVTKGNTKTLKLNLEKLAGKGVLIVTEDYQINTQISCINIIEYHGRMSFELNEINIHKLGLKISNQLKELATTQQ